MYLSPTKEKALEACRRFLSEYEAKYPKATDCLRKDEDVLFTFYDFPAAGACDSGRRVHRRRHGYSGLIEDRRDMFDSGPYIRADIDIPNSK